ncbi:MAG: transposase [Actinobacteria bacterium]|nr:transposase [Actinomycetota bacterium]
MKRTRDTSEQVIRKLRDADRMLAEHKSVAEIAKELGVSENTYHRWRNQFGGMKADDVKRLRELERENQRLKRIVADQAWTSTASRRSRGETSEPGASACCGRDALRPPALQRASGLPAGWAAPFYAMSRAACGDGRGPRSAPRVARYRSS